MLLTMVYKSFKTMIVYDGHLLWIDISLTNTYDPSLFPSFQGCLHSPALVLSIYGLSLSKWCPMLIMAIQCLGIQGVSTI